MKKPERDAEQNLSPSPESHVFNLFKMNVEEELNALNSDNVKSGIKKWTLIIEINKMTADIGYVTTCSSLTFIKTTCPETGSTIRLKPKWLKKKLDSQKVALFKFGGVLSEQLDFNLNYSNKKILVIAFA